MIKRLLRIIIFLFFKCISKPYIGLKTYCYTFFGLIRAQIYRHLFAKCGSNFIINGRPLIHEPEKISVGNHVTINHGVQLCPRGSIVLSDHVTLSRGSQITAGELDMKCWANEGFKNHLHTQGDVFLGEGTWLCINSIVLPGVRITGKGVVVAAGAVVTKSFDEDYVILGGIPAKIVKRLNQEHETIK